MARAESTIRIDRSPDDVFAFVADPANNPQWRKNVVRTEWFDDGPMRLGRRGRQTARVLGREYTVEAVIVEWDPPRAAAWRTVQGSAAVRSWVRLAPDGPGTLLTYGADGAFLGPIGALLTRLAVPKMTSQAARDLAGLKALLESDR
jgi:carbon monoxide dehydrogenase subunit G